MIKLIRLSYPIPTEDLKNRFKNCLKKMIREFIIVNGEGKLVRRFIYIIKMEEENQNEEDQEEGYLNLAEEDSFSLPTVESIEKGMSEVLGF